MELFAPTSAMDLVRLLAQDAREAREIRRMPQEDLAHEAGLQRVCRSYLERGTSTNRACLRTPGGRAWCSNRHRPRRVSLKADDCLMAGVTPTNDISAGGMNVLAH
ncbi:hypothetical protein [Phenylobacterium sp.]|uniref:hypothetical protein n=1 Tax=Phenylobacterium sp. TaxID=1871053 RepID=UPI00286C0334|nr:hypothetical protein [Phenylobacterium sp.]